MASTSNQALIELIVKDSASGELKKASVNFAELKRAAGDAGYQIAQSGQNAETGLKRFAQSNVLGLGKRDFRELGLSAANALGGISGEADKLNADLGKTVRGVSELATSFGFMGPLGIAITAVSLGIGYIAAESAKAKDEAEKLLKPFEDVRAEIKALVEPKGLSKLASDLGVSEDALRKYISASKEGAATARTYVAAQEQITLKEAELKKAVEALRRAEEALADPTKQNIEDMMAQGFTIDTFQGVVEKARKRVVDLTSYLNGLRDAQKAFGTEQAQATKQFEQQTRTIDLVKNALPRAAEEMKNYRTEINRLAAEHQKATASFAYDWAEAERKAGIDRVKIARDTADNINKINEQLSTRIIDIQTNTVQQIGDIEKQHTNKLSEDYYQYAKAVESLNRDIAKSAASVAKDRKKAEEEFTQGLADINVDQQERLTALNEQQAHDKEQIDRQYWGREAELKKLVIDADANMERARILKEEEKRRADAQKRKEERLAEIAEREAEQAEEFEYRRNQQNEEYAHGKELGDRDMRDQIERAQRTADDQIAQARRTAEEQKRSAEETKQKQIQAVNEQLAETERAINKRRDDEVAAYAASRAAAKTAHDERVLQIQDLRTEEQRLAADMAALAGPAWEPWKREAQEYLALRQSMQVGPSPSNAPWSYGQWRKPAGWYAEGGDWIANRPQLIGIGDRPERVTITPIGQAGGRAGGGVTVQMSIVFNNASFTNPQGVERIANDLGFHFVQAVRARGLGL